MAKTRPNLVLIGMPGAGKSTVGVLLAKWTARYFVDTDVLIQTSQGRPLQAIVDTDGYVMLRKIEEDILLGLSVRNSVIATGGSAVHSDPAMAHLRTRGILVFLDASLATLESRIGDFSTRGVSLRPGQSFSELLDERHALYIKHADITITCDGMTHEQVCKSIVDKVTKSG